MCRWLKALNWGLVTGSVGPSSAQDCSHSANLTAIQPYNNGKCMGRAAAAVSQSYAAAVNGLGADLTRLLDSWPRGPE